MNNFLFFIQRILAALIDLILIYLPALLLVNIIFKQNPLGNILAAALFCVYNMIAVSSFDGRTIGKYFAKLRVKTNSSRFLDVSQRELSKILYFLPFGGPVFMVISLICYLVRGKFLHDIIGQSEVNLDRHN